MLQMSINTPACLSEEHFFIVEMSDWTKESKDWKVRLSHSHALDVAFGINMSRGIYAKFVKPNDQKRPQPMWVKRHAWDSKVTLWPRIP